METYYNIGDKVKIATTEARLIEFIGYKLAKHPSERGKNRVTLMERRDYINDKQFNTEQWIAITDNGTRINALFRLIKYERF